MRTLGGGTGGVNVWKVGCTPVSTAFCLIVSSCWGVVDDNNDDGGEIRGRDSEEEDGETGKGGNTDSIIEIDREGRDGGSGSGSEGRGGGGVG